MDTKYAAFLLSAYQLYLYLPDLSSSWTFYYHHLLPSFIVLVIVVYYLACIITIKKLINIDLLAYCCYCTYLISVILCFCCILLTALLPGLTTNFFNLICTVCKVF